jgi:dienelactone hydrolase
MANLKSKTIDGIRQSKWRVISIPVSCRTFMLGAILAIVLNLQTALASKDEAPFVSFEAQFSYWTSYAKQGGFKSFAIGPYGSFATAFRGRTQKQANSNALASCSQNVAADARYFKVRIKSKCTIFAEGDNILLPELWGASKWQTPAVGPDKPLNTGRAFRFYGGKPVSGILLLLHGCDGTGGGIVGKVWGKYLNSLGFSMFMPNSFADPRPEAICGVTPLAKRKASAEIMQIRLSQTLRSIDRIKSENPGVPLFVWGHSEGAFVAMSLASQVSGVIVSGEECDAYALPIATPENVPVMFIYGESDPYFDGVDLPLTPRKVEKCRNFIGKRKLDVVLVKNAAHYLRPWRPEVAESFSRFLIGRKIPPPAQAQHLAINLSPEGISFMNEHKSFRKHKAIAAHPDGAIASFSDVDYRIDAENFAAFQCDFDRGVNPFIEGKHTCTIQIVDDKLSPTK